MKRTALKRKSSLNSGSSLNRKKPLKQGSQLARKSPIKQKKSIGDYCRDKVKGVSSAPVTRKRIKTKIREKGVSRHWEVVGSMACMISNACGVTLHHCHGGSMREIGVTSGMAMKASDWLVIPLAAEYHCIGGEGIDSGKGVLSWEAAYGPQVVMLYQVWQRSGINVFEKAGCDMTRVSEFLLKHGIEI